MDQQTLDLTPIPRADRTRRITVTLAGVVHEVHTSPAVLAGGRPVGDYVPGWRGTCPSCLAGDVVGHVICRIGVDRTARTPTVVVEDLAVAPTHDAAAAAVLEARRERKPAEAAYLRQALYRCGHRDLV